MKKFLQRMLGRDASEVQVHAVYTLEHVRDGKVIHTEQVKNLMPTQGLNYVLDTALRNQSPATAFYMGLFSGNYTPVATLTAATVTASATEFVGYTSATRPAVSYAAAAGGVLTNTASVSSFTMNASGTIYGGFISSDSAKSGTAGVLASAVRFSASRSVVSGDILNVTHSITLTSV